jgi:hypothetical protein
MGNKTYGKVCLYSPMPFVLPFCFSRLSLGVAKESNYARDVGASVFFDIALPDS